MALFNFQKPDKVIMIESTEFEGIFEFRPLEPGYGLTIGNALRRVMLSSLEGFAITSLRFNQVDHEFSTLPGIVEDVTEMILNFKQVRLKQQIDAMDDETVFMRLAHGLFAEHVDLDRPIRLVGFRLGNLEMPLTRQSTLDLDE